MAYLFWFSLLFIAYTYIGYPLTLWFLTKFFPRPVLSQDNSTQLPTISVVVALKNEEKRVRARIYNLVEQNYPGSLELIVVSDNSTDATVAYAKDSVEEFTRENITIKVLELDSGAGKPCAVNMGVEAASGEVIVFADARQQFMPGSLAALASNFSDPDIGCVSGELVFVDGMDDGLQVEMGAYWRYEKAIRKMESLTGSVMGATGAIYAIRRELYTPLPEKTLLDDVLTPVNVLCAKKRVLFDSRAIATDTVSDNIDKEWRRKVRTLAGNWQLIGYGVLWQALIHGFLFRLFWHKFARVLVPFVLPCLLISSFLGESSFFYFCGAGQLLLYFLAFLGWKVPRVSQNAVVKLCYFFCVLNWAAVIGCWLWVRGKEGESWGGAGLKR